MKKIFQFVLIISTALDICLLSEITNKIDVNTFNQNCTTNVDCRQNFICSSNHQCVCSFGFILEKQTINNTQTVVCTKVNCDKCSTFFGINSQCNKNGSCFCNKPNFISSNNQCISLIGNKCQQNLDCGKNAVCNSESKCVCEFGYQADLHNLNCGQYQCQTQKDCATKFGQKTQCRAPSNSNITPFCDCENPIDYFKNVTTQLCDKRKTRRECSQDEDCKLKGICQNRVCRCKYGYVPNENDDCKQFQCFSDLECENLFKFSKCVSKNKQASYCIMKSLEKPKLLSIHFSFILVFCCVFNFIHLFYF